VGLRPGYRKWSDPDRQHSARLERRFELVAVVDKDAGSSERPVRWNLSGIPPPPPAARQWIAQPKPSSAESDYINRAPLFSKVLRTHCFALPWSALVELRARAADDIDIDNAARLAATASTSVHATLYQGSVPTEPYPRTFTRSGLVLEAGNAGNLKRRRNAPQVPALVTAERQLPLGVLIDPNADDPAIAVFIAARQPRFGKEQNRQKPAVIAVAAVAASPLGIANGVLDATVDALVDIVRRLDPSLPSTSVHERAIRRSMVAAIGPNPATADYGFVTVRSDVLNAIFLPWEDRPHVGLSRRCYFVHDIQNDVHSVICRSRRTRLSFTFLAQRLTGRHRSLANPLPATSESHGIQFPLQEWHLRLAPLVYERLRCIGVGQVELTRVLLPRVPITSREDTRHFSYIVLE